MSDLWVYLLGEVTGADIKIGHTKKETILQRLRTVNKEHMGRAEYLLLAGVRGSGKDEDHLKRYFDEYRRGDLGTRTEYFLAENPLVEYAAWLRSRWWATTDPALKLLECPVESPEHWYPGEGRRHVRPEDDPTKFIQDYEVARGALRGPWAWFPNPTPSIQDYFTPSEIIVPAATAMGGIDLDAASHFLANRVHRIPDYFDIGRCAFKHDWYGRVWLNPPYKNYGPWFERALLFIGTGAVTQMCMLSPVHAFTTGIAGQFMETASAMCLLSPTPKFWGNPEERTGTNLPHAVVYVGNRVAEFKHAFSFNDNILLRADVLRGST
jgi:hypothetical protein